MNYSPDDTASRLMQIKSEAALPQKTQNPTIMHNNSTLHECEDIFMSANTMHLQADKVKDIKYVTLIFLCHIPIFIAQENIIPTNSLTAIIWVCHKYNEVDTTCIKT